MNIILESLMLSPQSFHNSPKYEIKFWFSNGNYREFLFMKNISSLFKYTYNNKLKIIYHKLRYINPYIL